MASSTFPCCINLRACANSADESAEGAAGTAGTDCCAEAENPTNNTPQNTKRTAGHLDFIRELEHSRHPLYCALITLRSASRFSFASGWFGLICNARSKCNLASG